MSNRLEHIPERTQFTDEAYGVLGRALAFATDFERNCKLLASIIGIKMNIGDLFGDVDKMNEFVSAIHKKTLFKNITSIKDIKGIKDMDEDHLLAFDYVQDVFTDRLIKGKDARNYIAHEAGSVLEDILKDDERETFINNIKEKIHILADANICAMNLNNVMFKEPVMLAEYHDRYIKEVTDWVCETYDD